MSEKRFFYTVRTVCIGYALCRVTGIPCNGGCVVSKHICTKWMQQSPWESDIYWSSKEISHRFTEDCSSPFTQQFVTAIYNIPDESRPHTHTHILFRINLNTELSITFKIWEQINWFVTYYAGLVFTRDSVTPNWKFCIIYVCDIQELYDSTMDMERQCRKFSCHPTCLSLSTLCNFHHLTTHT